MKKTVLAAVMAAGVLFAAGAGSAESKTLRDVLNEKGIEFSVSANTDFFSKYVWRGMLLDGDNVYQPGIDVSFGNLTVGFWGSWDVESEDSLSSDEIDGYIDYSFDLGFLGENLEMLGMSAGHTWYTFPEADLRAREFYIGLSLDVFLSPSITVYRDYSKESSGGADGEYYIAGISHSLVVSERCGVTLDLGQEAGWNEGYFIAGSGGYALTTAGLNVPLSENTTVSLKAGYSIPFGDLKAGDDGNQDKEFYYGAGLAFVF